MTLSRKGAKSRTGGRKLRSTGTKAKTRINPTRKSPAADLEQQLAARTRELAEARKHLDKSLEHQTATAEVLQVISSSPGELGPVFEAMLANAVRLCEAKFGDLYLYEGGRLRMVAAHNVPPAYAEARRRGPFHPPPGGTYAEAIRTKRTVQLADFSATQAYAARHQAAVEAVELGGVRTIVVAPLLKDDVVIEIIGIFRQEVRLFSDRQVALLTNFAAQAVIAIENTRLLNELRQRTDDLGESLQQQTATAEILTVISNSLDDTQPVFDAIVQSGLKLFPHATIVVTLADGDQVRAAAVADPDSARTEVLRRQWPIPLSREYHHGLAILEARLVDIPDATNAPPEFAPGNRAFLATGNRAITIMPMRRGRAAIGTVSIIRLTPGPLSDKQVAVLRTFANQAVIAIENTRLLNELRQRTDDLSESLEQQTATSEVLQVISSSPGELEPVFTAMLANATRICGAKFGVLWLTESDGFRSVALHGAPSAFVEARRREPVVRPGPGTGLGRVARTKQVVHVADLTAEQAYVERDPMRIAIVEQAGARTFVVVPMLKDNELVGAINVYRQEVRPFTDKQIALLTNFANQAVIAIENTRLLNELRKSSQQQTATADVLKVISRSTFDLRTVLDALVESASRLCDAPHGLIFRFDGRYCRAVAAYNNVIGFKELWEENPIAPIGRLQPAGPSSKAAWCTSPMCWRTRNTTHLMEH